MDLSQIKTRISCPEYLRSQGISVPSRIPGRMISPLRAGASNPTSFLLQDDHWYDFGSGNGGDVIDLAAQLEFSGDLGKAIRSLSAKLGLQINHPTGKWHDAIQELCNRAAYYHSKLTDSDRDYLHNRGFTDATIDEVMIGHVTDGYLHGRLFLPYFKNDYVCYYATRAMPDSAQPENKYMKAALDESPFYDHIPWGLPTLSRTQHPGLLVISEGYFDALSWYQEGYCVLSAITGRFSKDQLSTVLAACNSFDRVLIIYDNDPVSHAGAGFTQTMAEWLFDHHIKFDVACTEDVKDVNDYYVIHKELDSLVESRTSGLLYLARQYTEITDLEHFICKAQRVASKTVLASVIDALEYPTAVKKSLLELSRSTPKESFISEAIQKEHLLAYVSEVGFYEWKGKIWERIEDVEVRRYADEAYGPSFESAQRAKQMVAKLQADCYAKEQFDRHPIITFQNGTLEIETGNFRDPSPLDYASIIMDYNYDPNATCPNWENFIHDICNDIGQREDMLQKIAGYIMRPDCDEQKIFILVGSGGNGKSVYLNVLQKLYNSINASHVEPTGLTQDFQRIKLRDSLMNIGADISSNFSKEEIREWLLKISVGDTISACYKGKDYIDFKPRCKLIYACNEAPRVNLASGLDRRFMYIDFDIKYVEYPDPNNPLQRKIDKHLEPKLLAELPGIFNWAYAGYNNLIRDAGFTETPEQARYIKDLEESADPVITFLHEMNYGGIIPNTTLFKDYRAWCEDNGHKALAANRFFPRLAKILKNRLVWNKTYYDPTSKTTYRACNIIKDTSPDPDDIAYVYPTPNENLHL